MTQQRPYGYWRNLSNIRTSVRKVTSDLGHFPSRDELNKRGLGDLAAAIGYYGGFRVMRQKLGYKSGKAEDGYWDNWKNVRKEIERVKRENDLDTLPSHHDLIDLDEAALSLGIKRHGGYQAVRRKLKEKQRQKPKNYWKNWDNVRIRLQQVTKRLGRFPSEGDLEKLKMSDVLNGITKYHDGYRTARERLQVQLGISTENQKLVSMLEQYAEGGKE